MKNEKQMMQALQKRKQELVLKLKELNARKPEDETSMDAYEQEKNEIERELVEIMDRLTQLSYIFKK
jgi:chromosome segregation ATPase